MSECFQIAAMCQEILGEWKFSKHYGETSRRKGVKLEDSRGFFRQTTLTLRVEIIKKNSRKG